jgi:uncharacterized membrane protein
MSRISALTIASAVAGALALAASPTLAQGAKANFKCWGIAKKGQNDCANAAKTHSCAGQSTADYDLGDWKAVASKEDCAKMGGSDKPGKGMNPKAPKS